MASSRNWLRLLASILRKLCSTCKTEKPIGEFGKRRNSSDGLEGRCLECVCAKKAEWHAANPGKNAEWSRTWRAKNPERRREQLRKHAQTDAFKATQQRYRVTEGAREKAREHALAWAKRNPEKKQEMNNRYRARKFGATVGIVDYEEILERDGLWCYLCESAVEPDDIHFDHVVPLSKGGEHSMANIRVTHSRCNLSKGDRLLEAA